MARVNTPLAPAPSSLAPTKQPFRGWWIVFAGLLGIFVDAGIGGYAFSALFRPMADSLGTNPTNVVLGLTICSITAAVSSVIVGPLIDRYGARPSMVTGALLMGGSVIMLARVESLTEFYLFFGIGVGLARPLLGQIAPVAAVANWFIRKRAEAFALMSIGASLAGVILTPITGFIIAFSGWRAAWLTLGLVAVVIVAPFAFFVIRRRPEDIGQVADGGETEDDRELPVQADPGWTRGEVIRTRAFWLLLASQVLMTVPGSGLFVHFVAFGQDYGMETALATFFISVYAAGALSGRAVWTYLTRRLGIRRALMAQSYGWGAGIAILMLIAVVAPTPFLFFPAVAFIGVTGGGSIQLKSQVWADYFGRRIIGAITGYTALIQTVTGAGAPLFLGASRDATGSYLPGMAVFAACCVLAGIVLTWARAPVRKEANS
jgi:sugar phosphate permease